MEKCKELCLSWLGDSVGEGKENVSLKKGPLCWALWVSVHDISKLGGGAGGGGTNVLHRPRDIRLLPSPPHPTNGQPPVSLNAQCDLVPFSLIFFHKVGCQEIALIALLWLWLRIGQIVNVLGCEGQSASCNYLTPWQWHKSSLRWYVYEWVWL